MPSSSKAPLPTNYIVVSGLNQDVDITALRDFLSNMGEVVFCRPHSFDHIHTSLDDIADPRRDISGGSAIVTSVLIRFKDAEAALIASLMTDVEIQNTKIGIKLISEDEIEQDKSKFSMLAQMVNRFKNMTSSLFSFSR